jgi:hypothetical protein
MAGIMAIRNQRQYRVAKEWAERFSRDLVSLQDPSVVLSRTESLRRRAMESQLDGLRREISDYEVWAS